MVYRSTLALASLLLLAAPLGADEGAFLRAHPEVREAIDLLDTWIEEQLAYHQLPGLSIGLVHDQEMIWSRGYGFADLESRTSATAATLYRIGSITKLFTATAILQLRDKGKLRLDDPVVAHLPGFAVDTPFPTAPEITVRHLLTHTSGLPREAAFPYWTDHLFPSRDEILATLPGQTAVFSPADTYKYSNLGMALLGHLVTALSGEEYADYVYRNIFQPLGMTASTVLPAAEQRRQMATGYMRRTPDGSRRVFDYYETAGMAPAANIVSTVEDLARFAALHLRGDDDRVLKQSTRLEMRRPHWVYRSWEGGRGLGFALSRRDGKTFVSHGGWIGGNRSHLLLVPEEKLAAIAIINADDGVPADFTYQAYDLAGPKIVASTAPPPAPRQADPDWQKYLGTYSDPWDWEYEVMILDGGLVLYSHDYPPEEDALSGVTRLEPLGGHAFSMPDGESVVFELDEDGRVERIRRRYDYLYPRKR